MGTEGHLWVEDRIKLSKDAIFKDCNHPKKCTSTFGACGHKARIHTRVRTNEDIGA